METATSKETIEQRVIDALVEFGAEREAIAPDATFESLDVDSLDLVELAQIVEDEYGVELREEDLAKLDTVGKAIDYVAERA
jgi:acyl carrier protein